MKELSSQEKPESESAFLTFKNNEMNGNKTQHNEVYFQEDWDTGIGGGLWSTGLAMAKYFQEHPQEVRRGLLASKRRQQEDSNTNTVEGSSGSGSGGGVTAIELGSGNGFLSVCLAAIAGDILKELVVTDMADHLSLMEKTILANSHIIPSHIVVNENGSDNEESISTNPRNQSVNDNELHCWIMEHQWGKFDKMTDERIEDVSSITLHESIHQGTKEFDFIFGSDVAYRDYLHEPLISTLLQLSHERTISLIGVTMHDTKPAFFTALTQAGFRYDRIVDAVMSSEFRGTTFGLFLIRRK